MHPVLTLRPQGGSGLASRARAARDNQSDPRHPRRIQFRRPAYEWTQHWRVATTAGIPRRGELDLASRLDEDQHRERVDHQPKNRDFLVEREGFEPLVSVRRGGPLDTTLADLRPFSFPENQARGFESLSLRQPVCLVGALAWLVRACTR